MSRFDIVRFKQAPDEEFICGICRNVLDNPKESPCRHVFCKVCITRALQEKAKCPICRTSIRERHLKDVLPLVQNLLNKLRMECEHKENGCEATLSLEGFLGHTSNCDYMMVSCKNELCDQKFLKRDSAFHECLFKTFVCDQGCECEVLCFDKDSHSCVETLLKKNKEAKARIAQLEEKVKELETKRQRTRNDSISSHGDDLSLSLGSPGLESDISLSGTSFSYNDLNYDSLSDLDGSVNARSPTLSLSASDNNDEGNNNISIWSPVVDRGLIENIDDRNQERAEDEGVDYDSQQERSDNDFSRDFLLRSSLSPFDHSRNGDSANNGGGLHSLFGATSNSSSESGEGVEAASLDRKRTRSSGDVGTESGSHLSKRARCGEAGQSTSTAGIESDNGNGSGSVIVVSGDHPTPDEDNRAGLRRSARLRNLPAIPVADPINDIETPVATSALIELYLNDQSSSSDDSWSPYLDLRHPPL